MFFYNLQDDDSKIMVQIVLKIRSLIDFLSNYRSRTSDCQKVKIRELWQPRVVSFLEF